MESITFLGLAFPQTLRSVLAVIVGIVLSAFRGDLLLLGWLTRGGTTLEWGQERKVFPWLVLYPDRVSRIVTQVTLLWMPGFCCSLVGSVELFRLGQSTSRIPLGVVFVTAGLSFWLGSSTMDLLRTLLTSRTEAQPGRLAEGH